MKIQTFLTITKINKYFEKINIPTLCWLRKKPIYQTNSNTPMRSYIIYFRTLWKISEVNWLKIDGCVTSFCSRPPALFFQLFFSRRPSTNSTGVKKYSRRKTVLRDQTTLEVTTITFSVFLRYSSTIGYKHKCCDFD